MSQYKTRKRVNYKDPQRCYGNLYKLREKNGYNQKELADKIGCSRTAYVGYENGDRTLPCDIAIKLARFYGVSIDYLLGKSDHKTLSNADIGNITGLSDAAIERLMNIKTRDQAHTYVHTDILSKLIENKDFEYFLALLASHPNGNLDSICIDDLYIKDFQKQAIINSELKDIVISIAGQIRQYVEINPYAWIYAFVFGLHHENKISDEQLQYYIKKMDNRDFSEIT